MGRDLVSLWTYITMWFLGYAWSLGLGGSTEIWDLVVHPLGSSPGSWDFCSIKKDTSALIKVDRRLERCHPLGSA